jgi:hypothetical protein
MGTGRRVRSPRKSFAAIHTLIIIWGRVLSKRRLIFLRQCVIRLPSIRFRDKHLLRHRCILHRTACRERTASPIIWRAVAHFGSATETSCGWRAVLPRLS